MTLDRAQPCDPHRHLAGIQKMEEGGARGRLSHAKEQWNLVPRILSRREKKKTDRTDPTTRSRHGMEPEHVACGTTLAVVEDTKKRSLSRYSPAPNTSWGWRVEGRFRQVGSMGPRARASPSGDPNPGLSLGGTSCALCGSSSRRVLRLSHRVGFAGLFSTTAVFSPCLHLALAGPWFLGRRYGCYVRVSGTKGDVYILCQFGAHARRGTAEHPPQIYKWSQLQEDLELVAVCDALGMVQR